MTHDCPACAWLLRKLAIAEIFARRSPGEDGWLGGMPDEAEIATMVSEVLEDMKHELKMTHDNIPVDELDKAIEHCKERLHSYERHHSITPIPVFQGELKTVLKALELAEERFQKIREVTAKWTEEIERRDKQYESDVGDGIWHGKKEARADILNVLEGKS